jgi:hypothetical protein
LHVTVIVSGIETQMLALRIVYALNLRAHVTVVDSGNTDSARTFLSVLDRTAAVQDPSFMGFEMVVALDLLTKLPAALVEELSAALAPYMHARSKALVSVLGLSASAEDAAAEWCESCILFMLRILHFELLECAGMSPLEHCQTPVLIHPVFSLMLLILTVHLSPKKVGSSPAVAAASSSSSSPVCGA